MKAYQMKTETRPSRRILVVEDDEDMRENLQRILVGAGHEVHLPRNGAEAITVLETHPCHLVLSDLVMPGMGGLELVRQIRQHDQIVPVVFLSAFGDRATMAKATQMGVVDFLTKPFLAASLLGLVERILSSHSSR